MVLKREITARIREVLEKHPNGLSITDLVGFVDINRNTAGRYLENLLLSGQVEMRHFGMAKIYTLAKRLPVSSVLSISSELVLQLDHSQRIYYANEPLISFLGVQARDFLGKNIEFTRFPLVFEDVFPAMLDRFRNGLRGEEWNGELSHPVKGTSFFCRVAPTVFSEGTKGVSILLEDITEQKRDGERIRRSEERLRSIFRASPVGIGVEKDRILLEVNDRFCQMIGYSTGELVGKPTRMLYPTDAEYDRVGSQKYIQLRQSDVCSLETQWVRKDGSAIDVILSLAPLDPINVSDGFTFTALDISGRTRAEQALRESEDRYRSLAEASRDVIFVIGRDDRVEYVNSLAAEILGLPADQIIGKKRSSLFPLEIARGQALGLKQVFETGKPVRNEGALRSNGAGPARWFDHYLTPIAGEGGFVRSVLGVSRDISERIHAETALRESEDRYRKLVEISPDAVILHRDGKIIYANPAAVRLAGAGSPEVLTGMAILDIVAPEYRDAVRGNISRDIIGEVTPPMELRLLRIDRTPVMAEGRGVSTSIDGKPAVLVALNDITGRYDAALALKKSEERYRSVFENTGAATSIVEENTLISLANAEFEHLSGYTKREIEMKKSWTEFVAKEDLEVMLSRHYQRRDGGDVPRQYEFRFVRRGGGVRRVLMTIDLIPGTTQTVASILDITDRRIADEQLLQREQQYRFIADNSLDIINRQTPECICTYVSPAITPLLGYTEMDVLGKSVLSMVHPEDLGMVQRDLQAIARSGKSHITATFRFRHKDGHYLWFESTTRIVRDEKTGQIREFLSISRNVTERIAAAEANRQK